MLGNSVVHNSCYVLGKLFTLLKKKRKKKARGEQFLH